MLGGERFAFLGGDLKLGLVADRFVGFAQGQVGALQVSLGGELGVARALLKECEVQMQLPRVRLSVRRSNQGAIDLYEKLGYSHVDVWKKYYHNGEDGLVMEKKMNP